MTDIITGHSAEMSALDADDAEHAKKLAAMTDKQRAEWQAESDKRWANLLASADFRTVAIYVKASAGTYVTTCISQHPERHNPGFISRSDCIWHDVIHNVPRDVTNDEVLRLHGLTVWHNTNECDWIDLKPGAIIR